jgi:hypothetical protein
MEPGPHDLSGQGTASVTDAQCKAQRQQVDLALRALDGMVVSTRYKKSRDSLDVAAALAARSS